MEKEKRIAECPISFDDANIGNKNFYCLTGTQTDIWSNIAWRAGYEMSKQRMALEKQAITYSQRLEYERQLKEMKVQYKTFLELMGMTIYCDSGGDIILAITSPEGKPIRAKRLLNVSGYGSRMYISTEPTLVMVLECYWGDDKHNMVRFLHTEEGITPEKFLKRLKAKGILMLVSGRTEKKAANALLAHSVSSAEEVYIPYTHGWGKKKNGSWHFATEGELTMREVLRNV